MSRYYKLKTARPLPDNYIPAKVTQHSPDQNTKVDHGVVWRCDPSRDDAEPSIYVYGDRYIHIDPTSPYETSVVELDLEDPVVALQLLLRYRELLGNGSDFVRQLDILSSLIATDDGGKRRRRMFLYNLLLELDVPAADAAKKEST
jgi:hypothetical protein